MLLWVHEPAGFEAGSLGSSFDLVSLLNTSKPDYNPESPF